MGPVEYDPIAVRDLAARNGIDPNLVPGSIHGGAAIGDHLVVKQVVANKPPVSPNQRLRVIGREENDSTITINYSAVDMTAEELLDVKLRELKAVHKRYITTRLPYSGVMISHDGAAKSDAKDLMDAFTAGWAAATTWRAKAVVNLNTPGHLADRNASASLDIADSTAATELYRAILTRYALGYKVRGELEIQMNLAVSTGDLPALQDINVSQRFTTAIADALAL